MLRASRYLGLAALLVLFADSVSSFSVDTSNAAAVTSKCWDRRSALAKLASSVPIASSLLTFTPAAAASDSSRVYTVVVDSPDSALRVGIEFVDIKIDSKEVPSVDKVQPDSLAAASGVQPGMILLGKDSATKSSSKNVDFRIANGPYPFVLQFATIEESMAREAQLQEQMNPSPGSGSSIPLDPYGQLTVSKVQKPPSCGDSARRGDTVTIAYEARIGGSSGPLYDSSAWRQGKPATFELGKNFALPGVEIGLNGMCIGEVREIDIPTQLGYGRYGSQVFDIPGDVRLWWRVELLDLTKGSRKANQRFK